MRIFSDINQLAYIGRLNSLPAQVMNTKFGDQPPLPPSIVAATFDWAAYGASTSNPNISALVELPTQGARQLLDKIFSIRIDNLGNPVPVYVVFPDTGYTVVAPPNSVVWEPVQTGQFSALVVGEGFTTGQIGQTAVYFCNFKVPPFIDQEFQQIAQLQKASASISRGSTIYNQNFGVPALGDQFFNGILAVNTLGSLSVFPAQASGFIYVTALSLYLVNASYNFAVNMRVVFESLGVAGVFANFDFFIDPATLPSDIKTICQITGQWKLDATQTWRLRNVAAAGTGGVNCFMSYTINPT